MISFAAMTGIVRWTPRKKAAVVDQILSGALTAEEAMRLYSLSPAELISWVRAIKAHGVPALRATRLHCYHPERRGR